MLSLDRPRSGKAPGDGAAVATLFGAALSRHGGAREEVDRVLARFEETRVVRGGIRPLVARAGLLMTPVGTLVEWVDRCWTGAVWRREVVVEGALIESGVERRLSGVIDLLLEVDYGLVVIDHKTFPGTTEASWRLQAEKPVGPLDAYARVLGKWRSAVARALGSTCRLAGAR